MNRTIKQTATHVREQGSSGATLRVNKLTKEYAGQAGAPSNVVFRDIDLEIDAGEFVTIIGPSGCGKSTLLDCIAGLTPYDSGSVEHEGHKLVGPGPDRAVVFQSASLFPWRTLERNVAYGAETCGWDRSLIRERVRWAIELVGLEGYERHYPYQLSGGMQQRANLARALVMDSPILLMDEPFGALDAMRRTELQDELLKLQQKLDRTIVFVTHDIEEAIYLADKVAVMGIDPGGVRLVHEVPFPRPRSRDLVDSPEFRALARTMSSQLELLKQGKN